MPMYEYQCENGHHFEVRQSFSDAALTVCPTCGAKVHRVIQPAGIVFKGSGFYVTDSRGKQNLTTSGEKKTGDAASSAEGGADSSNGAKAEPAKTSETNSTAASSNGNGSASSTPAAASSPAASDKS